MVFLGGFASKEPIEKDPEAVGRFEGMRSRSQRAVMGIAHVVGAGSDEHKQA